MLAGYAGYLRSLVDLTGIRPLKVVVDAGNGMAGLTTPAVLGDASCRRCRWRSCRCTSSWTAPSPTTRPTRWNRKTCVDLQAAVLEHGADIGLAFDGDADRCFVIDDTGDPVSPSAITALVARREIARAQAAGEDAPGRHPQPDHLPRRARSSLPRAGGRAVRTRVGHSFIKAVMAEEGAVFGGEHSAHYYFRDFYNADTGMLAAMHVLAALGEQDGAAVRAGRRIRALPRLR